jgi:uncharacterized protein (TIGR02231 family)
MKILLTLLSSFCFLSLIAQTDTAKAVATLNHATVYYGYGAELNHSTKIGINKNTKFIVIDKLATNIDINSLQISVPENVSLLAQQFTTYNLPLPIKPKSNKNDVQIKKMRDSIKLNGKLLQVLGNKIDIEQTVLLKTEKMIESTIATSGNKTALNTDVLKLIEFYNAKVERNKKLIFDYTQEQELIREKNMEINERIAILENELEAQENNEEQDEEKYKTQGRLIMQVMCNTTENADIKLSYFTSNAGWQPLYDIRVTSKTNDVKLIYKATLTQNTGINWKNVKLTLSTSAPNFSTEAPLLSAWYLQLYAPQVFKALSGKVSGVNANNTNFNINMTPQPTLDNNDEAKETEDVSVLDNYVNLKQGLLNTSFEIDLPYDIESNGVAHSINVKSTIIKSKIKNYAVPKLDATPYLIAEITDWQNLDLIPGNANIILDDTYIGKSFINPNTTLDTLNLSLGKDKRIAVKRTLVKDASKSKSKDNFITQTFVYEITVRNNKTTDVSLVLKDQYPLSNNTDIETKLLDDDKATVNEELGTLTWRVKLGAGESKTYRFSYSVKYPKDKKVQNL